MSYGINCISIHVTLSVLQRVNVKEGQGRCPEPEGSLYMTWRSSDPSQMFIFPFMGTLEARLNEQLTPVVQPPPAVEKPSGNTNHSIETLVVVLAVITILAVIAGILARLCGGRHFGGNGEHDIEGWTKSASLVRLKVRPSMPEQGDSLALHRVYLDMIPSSCSVDWSTSLETKAVEYICRFSAREI
ncbi:hypothetical protein SADUNF_Sadunf06G0037000 [Salix dunnii]|uniref:Uncharacterized protein n=1 Tax=Salix dunnii TaxID=1413687 RepID=A0A835K0Z1_9ROSI|nr:hypothetical protein SADUNF_Sadunf06G0037000 [Salix dunnii]